MDAVAAGAGADVEHNVSGALGARLRDVIEGDDADRHRVNERIATVARVEDDLAGDGGHTDAVAVVCDSRDHVLE